MDGQWPVKGVEIVDASSWPIGEKWDGVILSVPHSGTHTLKKVLNTGHYHTGQIDPMRFQGWNVAVPIRDPMEIALSWSRRSPAEFPHVLWRLAWENLFDVFRRLTVTVFRIEGCAVHLGRTPLIGAPNRIPGIDWIYENEVIREIYGNAI